MRSQKVVIKILQQDIRKKPRAGVRPTKTHKDKSKYMFSYKKIKCGLNLLFREDF